MLVMNGPWDSSHYNGSWGLLSVSRSRAWAKLQMVPDVDSASIDYRNLLPSLPPGSMTQYVGMRECCTVQ